VLDSATGSVCLNVNGEKGAGSVSEIEADSLIKYFEMLMRIDAYAGASGTILSEAGGLSDLG